MLRWHFSQVLTHEVMSSLVLLYQFLLLIVGLRQWSGFYTVFWMTWAAQVSETEVIAQESNPQPEENLFVALWHIIMNSVFNLLNETHVIPVKNWHTHWCCKLFHPWRELTPLGVFFAKSFLLHKIWLCSQNPAQPLPMNFYIP